VTVQTEISRSGPYAGAGTTGPFTVGFRFLANSHLQVIRTLASGLDVTLALTTDYSVSGAGGSSGSVTLVAALASGERLTIVRDVPFTQLADYVENDAFPAESHENALDLLTMQTQQLDEISARSLTLPATVAGVSTELPSPEAGKVIGWNADGTELQNLDASTLASIVAYGTAVSNLFSGDGVQTSFVLSDNPSSVNNLDVSVGGVAQRPGIDYFWTTGTTLTFSVAPVVGVSNVLARYMQALAFGTGVAEDIGYTPSGTVTSTNVQGAIDEIVDDLSASSGSSLVGYMPAGTGAVATTVQQAIRDIPISITLYGAIMNSTAAAATNTAALAAAYLVSNNVIVPAGTLTLASDTPIPVNLKLYGYGSEVTFVQASGDMFVLTANFAGNSGPVFKDITFQNVTTNGKLFTYSTGADLGAIHFEHCNFSTANYHIYSTDLCVGHTFDSCRFTGATISSRFYKGLWVYSETKCYTWYNSIGITVSGSSSSTCSFLGSVFEYQTSVAIVLAANGGDILGWSFVGCHFEGNGSASGAEDVQLSTVTANKIRGIMFEDCGWFAPSVNSVLRVKSIAGGGGNIANISFRGGQVNGPNTGAPGAPYLCTASVYTYIEPTVSFQAGGAPPGCSTLAVGLQTQVNSSLANFGGTGISGAYTGTGNQTINTVGYNVGTGGALCIVRGINGLNGISWIRVFVVAIQTPSGATPVAAAQIGTAGDASAVVTISGAASLVTVQVASLPAAGGFWSASFIGL